MIPINGYVVAGGTLSLWTGFSLCSALEIGYWILQFVKYAVRKKKKNGK